MGSRERGGAPLYLTFTMAASIGAGIAAYTLIKQSRTNPASAAASAPAPAPAPARRIASERAERAAPEPVRADAAPLAIDRAAADAIDPPASSEDVPSFGRAGVSDGLVREEVERVVRARSYRLRRCYEKNATAPIGIVQLRFFIDSDGKVVQVSNMGIEDPVARCLDDQLRKMRFPKPTGVGASVVFPIRFAGGVSSGDPLQ